MKDTRQTAPQPLVALARLHGVQSSYLNMAGGRRQASVEALVALLRALGAPVARLADVPAALREAKRARAHRALEPVQVVWAGERTFIELQVNDQASRGPIRCEWGLEDGNTRRADTRLERLLVRRIAGVEGERFVTRALTVPARLPVGYHRLTVLCGDDQFQTEVFCAPRRCFQGQSRDRTWGVFAPLYALRSDRAWGTGDFGSLAEFMTWVAEQGGHFVSTLPLLPAFLGEPCEPSPYSPVSRLFWNEFYVDLARVPEIAAGGSVRRLTQSRAFRDQVKGFQESPLVDYDGEMKCKRRALEAASRLFFQTSSARRRELEDFLRENPQVESYARFRAVHEQRGESWAQWPARMRIGELRETDCQRSRLQYHVYVQWLAHEQMAQLSEHARQAGVGLYLDMPLGTHRDGYDTWRYQELFALNASGGAPPDPVFTQGQDWGFAPLHPQRSREQGHAYVRAVLRHHLRQARMLRLDHVMGLHRLYWVPRGLPASGGAYVTYPAEEFYAMLSIESHRRQAVIVGENLGTVPPEVNRSLKRHGVAGMFVVQYAARPRSGAALPPVPASAVASLNTHDMPPFAGWWHGLDIEDRYNLRLIKRENLDEETRLRFRICRALVRLLVRRGRLQPGKTMVHFAARAATELLGQSAARWVLINLEDLWFETEPQNTPGTTAERVNWRRKTRFKLEQLRGQGPWSPTLNALRRIRA